MSDPLMELISGTGASAGPDPLLSIKDRVEHRFADSDGVKIHYAALGSGPLAVMMHGFPDHWLTWRHQIDALSKQYRVCALSMRGRVTPISGIARSIAATKVLLFGPGQMR